MQLFLQDVRSILTVFQCVVVDSVGYLDTYLMYKWTVDS